MKSNYLLKLGAVFVSFSLLSMLNAETKQDKVKPTKEELAKIKEQKAKANAAKKAQRAEKRAKIELPDFIPSPIDKADRSSWGVKNGWFGGVGMGAGLMMFSTPNMNNNNRYGGNTICGIDNQCPATDSILTLDYSLKGGYQYYFTPYQGVRAYISYVGGSGFPGGGAGDTEYSLYYMNNSVDVNVDYLLEVAQTRRMSFGLIGGLYLGYNNFYRNLSGSMQTAGVNDTGSDNVGGFMVGLNLGVGYTFFRHHRVDIMARMPLMALSSNVAGVYVGNLYIANAGGGSSTSYLTETINYRYASINVSYSFIY